MSSLSGVQLEGNMLMKWLDSLMKTELMAINAAKWDRLIPCHGDVIESGGRVAWDKVWGKYAGTS